MEKPEYLKLIRAVRKFAVALDPQLLNDDEWDFIVLALNQTSHDEMRDVRGYMTFVLETAKTHQELQDFREYAHTSIRIRKEDDLRGFIAEIISRIDAILGPQ